MTEIIIENEQKKVVIPTEIEGVIKQVILKTLEFEECDFDAEVSVTIVDNEAIKEINSTQRGIDRATDVLSFPMLYFDENGDIIDCDYDSDGDLMMLGDIVISAERAVEQAAEYGHSFRREMAFLTVHSMLHLLGYDHVDDPEGERIMFGRQEEILREMGITRE
ncbi:MAG: rRNA maturation RNase YbeY [Clostridiales bacterium]|nr:rRNA maturation RNase YbeY [Clostridiales bacterium]